MGVSYVMEESKRIRVVFKDDDILTDTQKLEGLNRSWLLLKPHQLTIADVASHLFHAFKLHQSCPQGLLLSKSGFVLPPFESSSILKDDDVIRVRKRRIVLSLEGSNAGHELEKLEAVKQQPVNNVLLLANEEFENEKGGYESDDTEEEDDEDILQDIEDPSGQNVDSKKRKRKTAEKLHGLKKKKQRSEAPGDVANDVHTGKIESSSQGGVCAKMIRSQKEKESDSSSEDDVDNNKEGAEISDSNVSGVKGNAEIQENNSKEPENAKNADVETKKGPSRSARRKYAKRKWLQEMSKIQKLNATCELEGLKNWKEDHAKSERNKYDKSKGPQKWKKQRPDPERMEEGDEPKGLLHWKESHKNTMPVKGRKRQRENHHVVTFHKLPNQQGDVAQTLSSTETISKEAGTIVKEAIQEQMDRFLHQEKPNQTGDSREESNQDGDVNEQPNKRNGDLTEKPNQQNCDAQQSNENDDASEQSNQEDEGEKEIVPVVVRPGHIRFEPLEKDQAVQQNHVPSDTFQWNGITSKKKGQKWGTEKYSFSPRNDYKNSNKDYSGASTNKKLEQPIGEIDFENLPPLPCAPKVGDLIAYRLLELSSCWTPELSEFRVGKVTWYNSKSTKTVLAPVPEYPIVSKTDNDEDVVSDNSLYKEDGSLEIDFSALIAVRIIKDGNTEPRNATSTQVNEEPSKNENAPKLVSPSSNPEQTLEPNAVVKTGESNQGKSTPSPAGGNGGVDPWNEISEALNAKKNELTKESSWGKPTRTPLVLRDTSFGKNQQSPSNSWGKNSKNGQQSPANNWGKKVENGQPVKENSWGKQSWGSKSWSYKL